MLDDDDRVHFLLDYAIRDFVAAVNKLAWPPAGVWEFVSMYVAARAAVCARYYSNEQLLLLVLRRLTQDIVLSL